VADFWAKIAHQHIRIVQHVLALLRSRTGQDIGYSLGLKISYAGLMFLISVILARILGPREYGIYAYAFAVVQLLVLVAQAGLPTLVMRETARGIAREEFALVKGLWRWATGVVLGVSSGIILIGSIVLQATAKDATWGVKEWTLFWGLFLVPVVALSNVWAGALRGLQKIVSGLLVESYLRIAFFFAWLFICLVVGRWFAASDAMMFHVGAGGFALVLGGWYLWRKMPEVLRKVFPQYAVRIWIVSALPLIFLGGVHIVNSQADILMLSWLTSDEEVGLYRVAAQMALFASFGLQAVNMVVAPRFARLHAMGRMQELERLMHRSGQVILGFNLLVALVFWLGGPLILRLFFGEEFVASYLVLLILLGGQVINSLVGSVGYLLNMTGHERQTAYGMSVAAVVNIFLNVLLIPRFGMFGAAIATACSIVVWNILLWHAVRKHLRINSLVLASLVKKK